MGGEDKTIHDVASEGDAQRLASLLDEDPKLLHAEGWFARTPLHCAAGAGSEECVRLLIGRGADVNARDRLHSWTPLFGAVSAPLGRATNEQAVACARLLLEHGADPNARDTHRRETPLFNVMSLELLLLLEEYGADLGVVSSEDQFPFEQHAYRGDFRLLRFWVERGVDLNHVPGFQDPALVAVVAGSTDNTREDWEKADQLRWLLARGANPDIAETLFGRTALHFAAQRGSGPMAEALLDGGADPNARDHEGQTPLHVAAEEGHVHLLRLLVGRGGDANARDAWNKSALDLAGEFPEVAALLAPLTGDAAASRPKPEELLARLPERPRPCSESEIEEIESRFGVSLPAAYKKFLRLMGRGPRRFLESDHWSAFYPDLLSMGQGEEYEQECGHLPARYFVFASRLTYHLFFVADGSDDDPPIYAFGDGAGGTYAKAYDSLWDFIAEMVTYDEVMRKKRLT